MRMTTWLVIGIGSLSLLSGTTARAQDEFIQKELMKILELKREIAELERKLQQSGAPTTPANQFRLQILPTPDGKQPLFLMKLVPSEAPKAPKAPESGSSNKLEKILKEIREALAEQQPGELKMKFQFKLVEHKPVGTPPAAAKDSVQHKLDTILKEMAEMRRDIKSIKDSIGVADKKPAPAPATREQEAERARKALEMMLHKLREKGPQIEIEIERKKPASPEKKAPSDWKLFTPTRSAPDSGLEKTLQQVLQELDSLRREVQQLRRKRERD
jgi:hypothetical protein